MANQVSQIKQLSDDYTDVLEYLGNYFEDSGSDEYSEDKYKWFRPKDFEDLSDIEKLEMPFKTDNIKKQIEDVIKVEKMRQMQVSSGDFAISVMQSDFILSAARAFNEQHQSKLRMFAQNDGRIKSLGRDDNPSDKNDISPVGMILKEAEMMLERNQTQTNY
ncbi:hypothetical protein FACS1894214_0040 [Planctomycetales bacterium]|nr:hypothetical protein FACS1894214_0040 [Planctomycetales bacterium]